MATLEQAFSLAATQYQAGELSTAKSVCRDILRQVPGQPDTLHLLGVIEHRGGRNDEARDLIEQAISGNAREASFHLNLGIVNKALGKLDEAVAAYRKAIDIDHRFAAALCNLGNLLWEQGKVAESAEMARRALEVDPNLAAAHTNLGNALLAMGKPDEAVEHYRAVQQTSADDPQVTRRLGKALLASGRIIEAQQTFEGLIQQHGNDVDTLVGLGSAMREQGEPGAAVVCAQKAMKLAPGHPEACADLLHALNLLPGTDAMEVFAHHASWGKHSAAVAARPNEYRHTPDDERPLRIGYVLGDPAMRAIEHSGDAMEATCYMNAAQPGPWREIHALDDDDAAKMIRDDGIDVLVDMTGHLPGGRLGIFARKPAPVQVSLPGYVHTTGLETVDYRISDAIADPRDAATSYVEQIHRLTCGYRCYAPPSDAGDVVDSPAKRNGYVTFGSLVSHALFNAQVIEAWATLLKRTAGSRLLLAHDVYRGKMAERMAAWLVHFGVEIAKVSVQCGGNMAMYNDIDIALDTWPCAGDAAACDALWMGVPVVTRRGNVFAGRRTASVLSHAGVGEWISASAEGYIDTACQLASDLDALAAIRRTLRDRFAGSPVCDVAGYIEQLEGAYRHMWRRWCDRRR